ncbi:MAG: hypothetical protein E7A62_01125 [Actinomycetaceae bacterium]|nr:hypothetical protein [Actinomycetaceae bacterium]MDU0969579.1 hypothetical protein [Actinomycetaceae bacterium]
MAQRRLMVWAPQWGLHTAGGEYPPDTPTALATSRAILDVSPAAYALGVRPRMRVRQARALAPDLALLAPDPDRAQRAFGRVLEAMGTLRWDVVAWRAGVAEAPLGAFSTPDSEAQLLSQVIEVVAVDTGVDVSAGIANGTLGGLVAAHRGVIVPAGAERQLIAPLPVDWVTMVHDAGPLRRDLALFVDDLKSLGLATIGDVAALPEGALMSRFGVRGHLVATLAAGDDWPLAGIPLEQGDVTVSQDCDPPLLTAEQALFVAKTAADTLIARMRSAGQALTQVRITCHLGADAERTRTWMLDPPATSRDILTRMRWHLGEWLDDPDAVRGGVTCIQLTALAAVPLSSVGETLWGDDSSARHVRRAHDGAARVDRLLGAGGVRCVASQGGFDPRSRVVTWPWDSPPPPRADPAAPWPGVLGGPAPPTLLDTPAIVGVLDEHAAAVTVDPDGLLSAPPVRIVTALNQQTPIASYGGPYPVNGAWWDDADAPRAYLIVACTDAPTLLLVYRDQRWWHEGTYDSQQAVLV